MERTSLWPKTILTIFLIFISWTLFSPNVTSQDLVIVFNKNYRDAGGIKREISKQEISDFIQDRENGLLLYFPNNKCIPTVGDGSDAEHRCIISDHFITAAKINEVIQANPNLINPKLTKLAPNYVERIYARLMNKTSKNLKIKLGLDLQGGMRAVYRADYETYLNRLKEKTLPYLNRLQTEIKVESDPKKKQQLQADIDALEYKLDLSNAQKLDLLNQAKEVIEKRLAAQNLTEPEVRSQVDSYSIAIDMPGVSNSSEVLTQIKNTITVEYRIVNDAATEKVSLIPENIKDLEEIQAIYKSDSPNIEDAEEIFKKIVNRSNLTQKDGRLFLYWRRTRNNSKSTLLPREFRVLGPPLLDGSEMQNAWSGATPGSPWFQIYFRLSETGSNKFGELTKANVGKRMAILWGERVMSDPVLREAIYGGSGVISGQFSQKEAKEITSVIQEGALPIPLELSSVTSVGPTLGAASIISGILSILIGYAIVVIFMLGYYKLSGIVAVVTLFCNLLFLLCVMSLLEFTFTLPGIAGVILTVGMAVDANVIIFEKIKEDLRAGKVAIIAIENGYHASFWTILDSNVTGLISAIVLWLPKDGPIMGFAIVLFFGIVTSMYSSLTISKLILLWSAHILRLRNLSIGYGFKKLILQN